MKTSDPAKVNTFDFAGVKSDEVFGKDGNDPSLILEFAKAFEGVLFRDSSGTRSESVRVKAIEEGCEALQKLFKNPASAENDKEIVSQKRLIRMFLCSLIRDVYNQYAFKLPAPSRRDSFEVVVGKCFSDNQDVVEERYGKFMLLDFAYGTIMVDPKIMRERELSAAAARKANAQLPEGERLGALRMEQLDRIAADFRFPGGPSGTDDIDKATLKDILEVNVRMVRERLGYTEGEKINPGELKYLATFFKTMHQAKDTLGFGRGLAVSAALLNMRNNSGKPDFDPTDYYKLDRSQPIPMTRELLSLAPEEVEGLGLGDEAAELARLIRS